MYTILVNDDNTLIATEKQRIIQRSKLTDTFCFLAPAVYNGKNMENCIALLEYLTPVGREYKTEILVKDEKLYNGYIQYCLPIDTNFTREAGNIELQLSFILANITADGVQQQIVRKTSPTYKVEIIPISAWSDIIPDSALTPIDQRLIKMDAQLQAIADAGEISDRLHVDGLAFNTYTNELQLTADGTKIGNIVILNSNNANIGGGDNNQNPDVPPSGDDEGETDNVVDF